MPDRGPSVVKSLHGLTNDRAVDEGTPTSDIGRHGRRPPRGSDSVQIDQNQTEGSNRSRAAFKQPSPGPWLRSAGESWN